MRTFECSGCGVRNRAINDLSGMAHTRTGGKPSGCTGTYRPVAEQPVRAFGLTCSERGRPDIEREDLDDGQPPRLAL
jgi:hypothetical protein